jgi:hypothetical protein
MHCLGAKMGLSTSTMGTVQCVGEYELKRASGFILNPRCAL